MKPKCFLLCICNDKYNILSIYYMFIEAGDLSVGLTGLFFCTQGTIVLKLGTT